MKLTVSVIAIALLLFACILYVTHQEDGFAANICTPIVDAKVCVNTADCSWDKTQKKCFSCSDYTSCDTCVTDDNNKCGWCGDINKCIMSNNMGLPVGNACSDINYTVVNELCPANRKAQPKFDPGAPVTDQIDTSSPVPTYTNTACPDTDAIVKKVKAKFSDADIKKLVNAELTKNGIKVVEGFTNQEDNIALAVIGSISDDIRALVKKSVKSSH